MTVTWLDLLKKHRQAGSGRGRRGPWANNELSGELVKRGFRASEGAVSKWFSEANGISRPNLVALLDLMLPVPEPGHGTPHADHAAILAGFDADRPKRRLADELPVANATDWPRENPKPIEGLVELELFTPLPDNQGGYRLRGRLDLGEREDESTDQPVRIALRAALVTLEVTSNLVIDGSLIGKREPHENLAELPGGVRVVGPKRPDGCLEGEVFRESHIATVTPTDDAAAAATLRVVAPPRAFAVTALDARGEALEEMHPTAKDALLNLLFHERLPKDGAGRVELQKAVLRRKAKE